MRAPLGAPLRRRDSAGPRFLTRRFGSPLATRAGALCGGRGSRASGEPSGPPSASSWQGTVVSPGGAPAPPGSLEGAFIPPPAGAAPCFIIQTPLDDALG